MVQDFSLDNVFWRDFTKTYWHRKPTVIRAPFRNPLVTPPEVFRALVAATRRLRHPTDDFTFFIGKRRVLMDKELDRFLPRAEDVSLERYLARLKGTRAIGQLAIFVSHFQVELGWTIFSRLRQFLKGLYEIGGAPTWHAEVDLFIGNYRRTGVGVHRDSGDVFCLVVDGRKRIRAWPADDIPSNSPMTGPSPYGHLLRRSVCLEGRPGDIIYWPSSYWHIAESDGLPGSSLTLGLYYSSSLLDAFVDGLEARSGEILGDDDPIGSLPFSTTHLPPQVASTVRRLERGSGQLARELTCFWMERITGYGFARLPRAGRRVPLRMGKSVRANPTSPILYQKFHRELAISANGRSIVLPYRREVLQVIRTLRRGRVCSVAALLTASPRKSPPLSRQAVRRTLQFLLDERALEYA